MTFTEGRANEINRDNAILVSKLSNIHIERKKPNASMVAQPFRIAASRTAAAINRRKQDEKIARENAALAQTLARSYVQQALPHASDARLETGERLSSKSWPRRPVDVGRWRWRQAARWQWKCKGSHITALEAVAAPLMGKSVAFYFRKAAA